MRAQRRLPPASPLMWSQGDLDQNIRRGRENLYSTDRVQGPIQEMTLSRLMCHSATKWFSRKTCGLPQHNIIIIGYLLASSGQKCQAIYRETKTLTNRVAALEAVMLRNKWSFVYFSFYGSKSSKPDGMLSRTPGWEAINTDRPDQEGHYCFRCTVSKDGTYTYIGTIYTNTTILVHLYLYWYY